MKVKKYEASDMQEAIIKIKSDLGDDAVILHTKKITKGGFLGLFTKDAVEVLAGVDVNLGDSSLTTQVLPEINERFKSLEGELKEVKSFIHTLIKQIKEGHLHFSNNLEDLYLILLQNEVEEKLSQKLIQEISEDVKGERKELSVLKEMLLQKIVNILGEASPISLEDNSCKIIALIGPTGVGKTTTLVKLGANFVLQGEKRVAFITADTYRIAAIDQLKTYAEIIGIPVEVVYSPEEMRKAVAKHMDRDLILIDTAGRSQKNVMQLYELKDFLESASPSEVHLVLSATTTYKGLLDVIEKFSVVPVEKFLFTKLDEAINFGFILNIIAKMNKKISYVTVGQVVPVDIEVFDSKKMARMILGEENLNGEK